MIQRSFDACAITATNPGLVHSDDFLKRIMANVEMVSDWTDDDNIFYLKSKIKHFLSSFCISYLLVFVLFY